MEKQKCYISVTTEYNLLSIHVLVQDSYRKVCKLILDLRFFLFIAEVKRVDSQFFLVGLDLGFACPVPSFSEMKEIG